MTNVLFKFFRHRCALSGFYYASNKRLFAGGIVFSLSRLFFFVLAPRAPVRARQSQGMTRVIETRTRTSSPALCATWWLEGYGGVFVLTMTKTKTTRLQGPMRPRCRRDGYGGVFVLMMTKTKTTRLQGPMRPRCRRHRFCQPSRKHRQLDDNAETARQWAAFSAHYKGKAPQPQDTNFLAWRPVGELAVAPQRNEFVCLRASSGRVFTRRGPWGQDVVNLQRSTGKRINNLRPRSGRKASSHFVAPLIPPPPR